MFRFYKQIAYIKEQIDTNPSYLELKSNKQLEYIFKVSTVKLFKTIQKPKFLNPIITLEPKAKNWISRDLNKIMPKQNIINVKVNKLDVVKDKIKRQ